MNFKEWLKRTINEDYKTSFKKFEKDNPNINQEAIKKYLDDFKKIIKKKYKQIFDTIEGVSVPKEKRKDIDSYKTFSELEAFVDYIKGQVPFSGSFVDKIDVDGKPVFEDSEIIIYYADSPNACVSYKGKGPYSWCIARKDAGNLFYAYRFKQNHPSFYFVKNKKKTKKEFELWNIAKNSYKGKFNDPWHFFVVQVFKDAKTNEKQKKQYSITSANNDGDKISSWQEIIEIEPLLENLQEIFKPIPISKEEQEDYEIFSKGVSDEQFSKLTFERKNRYIDIFVSLDNLLTDNQFKQLPEELKNKYIGTGVGLTKKQYELIKGTNLEKRYSKVTLEKSKFIIDSDEEISPLKESEIEVIKDKLDYKKIDIHDIGKLLGIYVRSSEYGYEDEDEDEDEYEYEWNYTVDLPEVADEVFDKYIENNGTKKYERTILKRFYNDPEKILLHIREDEISLIDFENTIKKSLPKIGQIFTKEKELKLQKIMEFFEKIKEKTLLKNKPTKKEIMIILSYSENFEDAVRKVISSNFVFTKEFINFFMVSFDQEEKIKFFSETLIEEKERLPNHPLLVIYAQNINKALEKMQQKHFDTIEIDNIIKFRGYSRINSKTKQDFNEYVLKNHKDPLHWIILKLIKLSPDPVKSAIVASDNPEIFKGINNSLSEKLNDLIEFLQKNTPKEIFQKIMENIIIKLSNKDHDSTNTFITVLKSSPNKKRIIEIVSENILSNSINDSRYHPYLITTLNKMSEEDLSAIRKKISDPKFLFHVDIKQYIQSLDNIEISHENVNQWQQKLNAQGLSQEDKVEISNELLKKTKFDYRDYGVRNFIKELVEITPNKNWALETIIQNFRIIVISEFVNVIKEIFPNVDSELVLDLMFKIKKTYSFSYAQIEDLLKISNNKDKIARIVGIDNIKKIARNEVFPNVPPNFISNSEKYLKEKGINF